MQFFNNSYTKFDLKFSVFFGVFVFIILWFSSVDLYAHPSHSDKQPKSWWCHFDTPHVTVENIKDKQARDKSNHSIHNPNTAQHEGSRAGDRK